MFKRIKLMTDYDCYPLWDIDDPGDIDPSELPLSEETVKRLLQWQQTYEGIMNWDDPHSAGFASEADRVAFEEEGISLWQQLQQELGNDWEVSYFSELQGKLLKTPTELLSRQ
ncbi:hypothetical protein H6F73_03590 [Microcoleus sp. FACHB-68]|nr:hypothetical protein [Microcoleus sp. FACHB-68]